MSGENLRLKDCVTCHSHKHAISVELLVDGEEYPAHMVATVGTAPEWYTKTGIYSSLPRQFTCDERYRRETLEVHSPSWGRQVCLNTRNTTLQSDAIIAYWAAKRSSEITGPADAYGDFENAGIAQCIDHQCCFRMELPGKYAVDDVVYPSHFHLTHWTGDRWSQVAQTVNMETS